MVILYKKNIFTECICPETLFLSIWKDVKTAVFLRVKVISLSLGGIMEQTDLWGLRPSCFLLLILRAPFEGVDFGFEFLISFLVSLCSISSDSR